jgi:hypothetical protein
MSPALRRACLVAAGWLALAGCPAGGPTGASPQPVKPAATKVPAKAVPTPSPEKLLAFEVVVTAPAALAKGEASGVAGDWEPVADAEVALALAATGRAIAEAPPAKTDATGHAKFTIKPPGGPLLLTAKVGKAALLRIYPVVDGAKATVDPATTLVAAFFNRLEIGRYDAMKRIDAPRLEAVALKVRTKLRANPEGIDLATEAAAATGFETLMAEDAALEQQAYAALGRSVLGGGKPTPDTTTP